MATKINPGLIIAGVVGLLALSRGTAGAAAEAPDVFGGFDLQTFAGFDDEIEGEGVAGVDFAPLDFGSLDFDVPGEAADSEPADVFGGFSAEDFASFDDDIEGEVPSEVAPEGVATDLFLRLSDLERIRAFYVEDLLTAQGIPADFFGGTVAGRDQVTIFESYLTIIEEYKASLDRLAGIAAVSAAVADAIAQLTAQLEAQGITGFMLTGSTVEEVQVNAQIIVEEWGESQRALALLEQERQAELLRQQQTEQAAIDAETQARVDQMLEAAQETFALAEAERLAQEEAARQAAAPVVVEPVDVFGGFSVETFASFDDDIAGEPDDAPAVSEPDDVFGGFSAEDFASFDDEFDDAPSSEPAGGGFGGFADEVSAAQEIGF